MQFFTFGPTLQATLAGLTLIFLMWVAFASVNVIFKDRIIAAKDHHYQQMQSAYENRMADLQYSYDELNTALVSAEDRFKSTADELQTKQETISKLLGRKDAVDATLASLGTGGMNAAVKASTDDIRTSVSANAAMASDSLDSEIATGGAAAAEAPKEPAYSAAPSILPGTGPGTSQLGIMPQSIEPQPRTAKPARASFLDEAVTRFAEALLHPQPRIARPVANPPVLRALAEQTERVKEMGSQETALLVGVDRAIDGRIMALQTVLHHAGVNPNALEGQAEGAVGGPEIPIQSARIDGIADNTFTAAYLSGTAHVKELDTLFSAFHHVPLTTPVHGAQFELTSGYGARVDPFTRHIAFHPGVDFGGPWGSVVGATAPGVVVWAGPSGGYGNMVEIDHGYGFRTRYGHLSSILVRVGARVEKGSPIGKLGSTGRSTGPHVHYEVWQDNDRRDPSRFIEAGRHVLE